MTADLREQYEQLAEVPILRLIRPHHSGAEVATIRAAVEVGLRDVGPWTYESFSRPPASDIDGFGRALDTAHVDSELRAALMSTVDAQQEARRVLSGRDDNQFSAWSLGRYGRPDAETLARARTILDAPGVEADQSRLLDASDLVRLVERALRRAELNEWSVEMDPDLVSTMSVRSDRQQVFVRSTARFTHLDARRLLAHEVGVHVFRSANAAGQPTAFAGASLGAVTATEEGLASWIEQELGVQNAGHLRTYALRAVAVDLAQTMGVVPLAAELATMTDLETAATIAMRVKRGLVDPNRPGGFTKDHAYLTGLEVVGQHLAARPFDLAALFATKWALEFLPLAQRLIAAGELRTTYVRVPSHALLEHAEYLA
jgi:hypothetical protein